MHHWSPQLANPMMNGDIRSCLASVSVLIHLVSLMTDIPVSSNKRRAAPLDFASTPLLKKTRLSSSRGTPRSALSKYYCLSFSPL